MIRYNVEDFLHSAQNNKAKQKNNYTPHSKRNAVIDFSQINKREKGPSFSSFSHLRYEPFPNRIHV